MKCVIFYDSPQRELQNAYLIKAELNKRGHDVYIYDLFYILNIEQPINFTPDVILVPQLYNSDIVNIYKSKFIGNVPRIVNLQCEQVLSNLWEQKGYHNPKGIAKNAIHLCWGEDSRCRLISNGVMEENAVLVGSTSIDLDRERFESIYDSKIEVSKKFNLDYKKKWILFISSFSAASNYESNIKFFIETFGESLATELINVNRISREEILKWIEKYIIENDCEFIYRMHPAEQEVPILLDLNEKYERFHLIYSDSVRSWIKVCDKVNTWFSTSIIDAYFMNKNCSILRPIELPPHFDSVVMNDANYITSYNDFCNYNNSLDLDCKFPISKELISKYYYIDENKYAYEKICDLLEDIVKRNIVMKDDRGVNGVMINDSLEQYLQNEKHENVNKLEHLIKSVDYKCIVVYPIAIKWEPMQRPQYILEDLAKKGYLCFFIDGDYESAQYNLNKCTVYEKKSVNLYNVFDEKALLYALQTYNPIVLCTWIIQLKWINLLPNKFIWYDILDKIENFSQYNDDYLNKHENLIKNADFVSYKDTTLKQYVKNRIDAKLVPDGDYEFIDYNINYKLLRSHAELIRSDDIDVYTVTFLDKGGYNYFSGGAERYLNDLYDLVSKYNINLNIYQCGDYQWVRRMGKINVISLAKGVENAEYSLEGIKYCADKFYNYSSNSLLSIYSPFFYRGKYANKNSIGLGHGVSWDHEFLNNLNAQIFWNTNKHIIDSAKAFKEIISVDTNTPNWFQTIDYNTSRKFKVIPNYADTNVFKPLDNKKNTNKITITYPRRLYGPRGLYLTLNVVDKVLEKYENVEFNFVGLGVEQDTINIDKKIEKWGDRVKYYSLLPEEMMKPYQISDIVLIPTIYSEGTSLSCLEAMASKTAIIATRVGGLTDLIIDGYNGRLINPDEESLLSAIEELIQDKEKREVYAQNAYLVSQAFSKDIWFEKWIEAMSQFVDLKSKKFNKVDNIYIKIYVNKSMCENIQFKKVIKHLLENKCFVVIKSDLDKDFMYKNSYARLQFEDIESENYNDKPDYIVDMIDKNILGSISFEELMNLSKYNNQ
ncbi:MAG: glycosyltransferase [Romboutsia sp.]|uniref:glycosyltransferase n=1 Tax=Romboutsia sp. TaxID=1965302 RepID=UPI003F3B1B77